MEETATPTVRRCSLCGEEGHIRSNKHFHPLVDEVVELVVEEIPIEEPLSIEIPIEEPLSIEIPIEEPLSIEIPIEEPLSIEIPIEEIAPLEEVVIEMPPIDEVVVLKKKTVFNTLNYGKKKPTEYHQLKVGR
jgi:hypothetical protein